jgi:SAM-dependent MidA family methyltransferase
MTLHSAVEQEIRELIREDGRITFAQFMQAALYSRRGGFYASDARIDAHFGTSAMTHPAFGALIARQLSEMWHLLGEPRRFDVIEVGSSDGSLARSIVDACRRTAPDFAEALRYVAADYEPRGPRSHPDIQRVKAEGLAAFRNVVGCILSNELIDNFPVHRFAVRDGRIEEIFVTVENGELAEVLDEPSSPRIEERIASLGLDLPEGFRGEVNLRLEDWTRELARALDRGFVLTIDYGGTAGELYSGDRDTLVCYHRHAVRQDPYRDIGRQDITCHVDFTSLMRLGERHGLTTVGYTTQRRFLTNLGFPSLLAALETQDVSAARRALSRLAMSALVDPQDYGELEVLAQAKGLARDAKLAGFADA